MNIIIIFNKLNIMLNKNILTFNGLLLNYRGISRSKIYTIQHIYNNLNFTKQQQYYKYLHKFHNKRKFKQIFIQLKTINI